MKNDATKMVPGRSYPIAGRLTVGEVRELIGGLDDEIPVTFEGMHDGYEYRAEEAVISTEGLLLIRVVQHRPLPE